jgi:hypothetical protein
MTTESSTAPPVLFPAFIYGINVKCLNAMEAEAKKWRKRYLEQGDLPELELIPVPPGEVIICSDSAPEIGSLGGGYTKKSRWHLYLIDFLESESYPCSPLDGDRNEIIRYTDFFEAHVSRYSWGALTYVTTHPDSDSIDTLERRIEGVLSFWEPLNTLKYAHYSVKRRSLQTLLDQNFSGHIAMWLDAPTGDARKDLRMVVDKMRRASPDETYARLVPRLYEVAKTATSLFKREWLLSPGVIEAAVKDTREKDPTSYVDISTGDNVRHERYLENLDRKYRLSGRC